MRSEKEEYEDSRLYTVYKSDYFCLRPDSTTRRDDKYK